MGCPVFAENRRWSENREIGLFAEGPFSRFFAHFFGRPSLRPFFLDSGLLSPGNRRRGGHTRNATKQRVSERFRVFLPLQALLACRKGLILRTRLEDHFFWVLLFCTVRCSKFCWNWVCRVKSPWGCRTELVLKRAFFAVCPLGGQIWRAVGAPRPCHFFLGFGIAAKNVLAAAARRVFSSFSVFFFFDPFSQTSSGPLHIPLFFFGCFSLLFAFFLGLGATPHCACVFGQLAFNPSYFGFFLGSFYKNTVFPAEKGLFWFISQCLPFVSPFRSHWLLSLFFVTLSFFFFCFFLFFSFLVVLFLFLPSLFFCCFFVVFLRFCFMKWTTWKYYIWSFLFCLSNMFLFLVFHYLSCVFWWTSVFSIFQEEHF